MSATLERVEDRGAPLQCDRAFIGEKRRCEDCRQAHPMWWMPDYFWELYASKPVDVRDKHLCAQCFIARAQAACLKAMGINMGAK